MTNPKHKLITPKTIPINKSTSGGAKKATRHQTEIWTLLLLSFCFVFLVRKQVSNSSKSAATFQGRGHMQKFSPPVFSLN
jgi:hypothetical protein